MTSTTNQTEQLNQTITEENEAFEQLPFTVHLIELRRRLIKCVGLIIALFFIMLPFANQLYEMLSSPLRGRLPEHATMIATDVTATFMAPFKLNFYVAFIIAMPFILYQIWQFLAPALYKTEKKSHYLFYFQVSYYFMQGLPLLISSPYPQS